MNYPQILGVFIFLKMLCICLYIFRNTKSGYLPVLRVYLRNVLTMTEVRPRVRGVWIKFYLSGER